MHDFEDDRILRYIGNETRLLTFMSALRVNSGTVEQRIARGDFTDSRAQANASITRSIAGCFRFLTLIQSGDRPARYGRSRRFDTRPSKPMLQAAETGPARSRLVRRAR